MCFVESVFYIFHDGARMIYEKCIANAIIVFRELHNFDIFCIVRYYNIKHSYGIKILHENCYPRRA